MTVQKVLKVAALTWRLECAKKDFYLQNLIDRNTTAQIRLRVFENVWSILFGNPDWDADKRGNWAHGILGVDTDCESLAINLCNDLTLYAEEDFSLEDGVLKVDRSVALTDEQVSGDDNHGKL